MDFTFLKPLASLPKLLAKPALQKLERSQLVIHLLKGSGIDILKPDFDSVYAHALVEYSVDNREKEAWITFFSLKETKEYIKTHLYLKPEEDIFRQLDGLLHTGQGEVFLQLKRENAQTEDAKREYLSLKKYLGEYTEKSQLPQQAYQTGLVKEVLDEINKMRETEEQQAFVLQNIDTNAQNILDFVSSLNVETKFNTALLIKLAEIISSLQITPQNKQTLIININKNMDKTVEQFKEELTELLRRKQQNAVVDILEKIDKILSHNEYNRTKWETLSSQITPMAFLVMPVVLVNSAQDLINSIR